MRDLEETGHIHRITDLRAGDHLCCIYQSEEEHRALLTPYLRQGLERGEKVFYIVDSHTAEEVFGYLEDEGLDVQPYLNSGQLSILTVDDAYMKEGSFDPEGMIDMLREETARALSEGFSALRVTGEMSWALKGLPGSERLIEYEAKLNDFFPGSSCLAICQYDRNRFGADILLDVLTTHPIAVIGTEIYENFYYIPPGEFLGTVLPDRTFDLRLRNLANQQKNLERLRERERRERAILDATADSLILHDLKGRILAINEVAARDIGKSVDELIGADLADLLPPTLFERTKAVTEEILSESVSVRREEEFEGRWYENTYYPVLDKKGDVGMLAVYSRDTTERKGAEENLRRYSHDLEERIKELNCLFGVSRIIETAELTLEKILDKVVDILPPAWQYPEVTCARLTLGDREFVTTDFEESAWRLSSDINAFGEKVGIVEVFYREERPQGVKGPFLAEERDLIDAIAERLGRVAERKTMVETLRVSEEKYRLIVDSAQEGIWTIDADTVTTFVNTRMADMLGYEVEEMLGRRLFDFMDEEGKKIARMNIERRKEGISEQHDFEFLKKDGSRIYAGLETSPLLDEDGGYIGALAMVADITERKRAEEELRESEERLRAMADASGDYIIMLDTDHRIRFINRTEEGIDRDSIVGTPLYELVDREDQDHVRSHLDRVIQNVSQQEYETVYHRPDGTDVYYSSVAVPLVVSDEVIGSVVNSRDITSRKSMEEALRESEDKYRSIVEQSSDGIVLVNSEGVVVEWNSAQGEIVGIKREEALGKYLWDVQYRVALPDHKTPETYKNLKAFTLHSLEEGYAAWMGETREREIRSADGSSRNIQAVTFPIHSRDSLMMGSITRDITQRVLAEEALARELEVNKALAELSSALLAQASLEDVSYLVLEKAKSLTASPYGYVGYIEAETGYLVAPTLCGDIWEKSEIEDKGFVFKEFKGLWGWVLEHRQPLLTNAAGEDTRSIGMPEGRVPARRFLSVPALLGGALVGQIAVAESERDYTVRDIETLNRLSDLFAMTVLRMWSEGELESYREHLEELVKERTMELERINRQLQEEISQRERDQEELLAKAEQLRALSTRLESVREEERRSVALEVHDTLGQALTGLKINLSLLGKRLAGERELESRIETMYELVDSTIQSVREISTELRPGILDDLGLAAALEWQLNRFGEITGLECSFVSQADEPLLDKELTVALFRITQEALTNIARHAGATRVDVRLAHEPGGILLQIMDNGRGITENEIAHSRSLGLLGMRERAHVFGGEVKIRGESGKGTTLLVRIPWELQEDGDGEEGGS